MKNIAYLLILLTPTLTQAQTLYKCKSADGDAVYAEAPCNAKSSKKVTLKDNTLDHTEMRKSKLYKPGEPVKGIDQSGPSVTSTKKIEGAGFQEFPPSNTGSSYTNFK